MKYRIYANGFRGYELIDVVDNLEEIEKVLDELNGELYYEYLVIEHNIKENYHNPIMHGYLDYNVNKQRGRV